MPNEPIRCFDGNGKPHEAFWTFRNAAETDSGEVELELYGTISEFSWFGDEVTPKMFKDQLYANGKNGPVTVRVNSYGGDLIAASVMAATLRDYPGTITVKVDGIAASAAVMVAIAGDKTLINASAYMMIHNPMVGIMGYYGVDDLKGLIDQLKSIKDGIVEGYAARTKMDAEKLSKLMNDETWMTASEAVALGFADGVISGSSKAANVAQFSNQLKTQFVNIPRALLNQTSNDQRPAVDEEKAHKAKRLVAQANMYLKKEM
jgi:ATP-dependent Clp protease protease subunit